MEDLEEIIAEFLVESHENLDQLDSDLVALEQDPTSRQLLGAIFRTIHTIKGSSPTSSPRWRTTWPPPAPSPTRSPTGPARRRRRSPPSTPPMRSSMSDSTSSPPE